MTDRKKHEPVSRKQQLMARFKLSDSDLRNPKIKNLFQEKLQLEEEIRELKKDEILFSDARVSQALARYGLCKGDFADPRIAWLLKGCVHAQLMLNSLKGTI